MVTMFLEFTGVDDLLIPRLNGESFQRRGAVINLWHHFNLRKNNKYHGQTHKFKKYHRRMRVS
jgi:hypothetical protein